MKISLRRRHALMVEDSAFSHKLDNVTIFRRFWILKGISIALLVQKLRGFWWTGGFYLVVELHREGSASAVCAGGLFFNTSFVLYKYYLKSIKLDENFTYGRPIYLSKYWVPTKKLAIWQSIFWSRPFTPVTPMTAGHSNHFGLSYWTYKLEWFMSLPIYALAMFRTRKCLKLLHPCSPCYS